MIKPVSARLFTEREVFTVDSALRFAKFFGNSPEFWLNLQLQYDHEERKRKLAQVLKKIDRFVMPKDGEVRQRREKCA